MVWLIVSLLANGDTIDAVLEAYPLLTREDVLAALAYAAEMAREKYVPLPVMADAQV